MSKGRFFRIVCGVMILIISVILIQVFVSDDDTVVDVDLDLTAEYADSSNWMGFLPDDVYLSEITIPGTHDSAARYVMLGYVMRCQDTDISEKACKCSGTGVLAGYCIERNAEKRQLWISDR